MRYNNCIKKGIKDTTWIDDFCMSCLEGEETDERVCTEKMLYALTKYTRTVTYLIDRFTTRIAELYINNATGYALVIVDTKYNKKVRIYDIKKCVESEYNRSLNELLNDKHYKKDVEIEEVLNCYKEIFKIESENYNYLHINLENNKTNGKIANDLISTLSVLKKLEDLEDKYDL